MSLVALLAVAVLHTASGRKHGYSSFNSPYDITESEQWKAKKTSWTDIYIVTTGEHFARAQQGVRSRARSTLAPRGKKTVGVVDAASGSSTYVEREALPSLVYLNRDLGFGSAAERASARASNIDSNLSRHGSSLTLRWLLYTNEKFAVPSLDNTFSRHLSFFGIILHDSDTPALLPIAERGGGRKKPPFGLGSQGAQSS